MKLISRVAAKVQSWIDKLPKQKPLDYSRLVEVMQLDRGRSYLLVIDKHQMSRESAERLAGELHRRFSISCLLVRCSNNFKTLTFYAIQDAQQPPAPTITVEQVKDGDS